MDYESIDRDMSSHVVTCVHNSTRFFVSVDNYCTDILSRARRFRWAEEAEAWAKYEREESNAWKGFDWQAMSVPAAAIA